MNPEVSSHGEMRQHDAGAIAGEDTGARYFDPTLWTGRRLRSSDRAEIEPSIVASGVRSIGFFQRPEHPDLSARNRRLDPPDRLHPSPLSPSPLDGPLELRGYRTGIA